MTFSSDSPADSQVKPRASRVSWTRFWSTSIPSIRLIFSPVSGTTGASAPSSDKTSTMPGATVPPATSWIKPVARRRAMGASSGRRPFSNLRVASVRSSKVWAVSRLLAPSNVADSRSTFTVLTLISLLAPPMTPPRPMASFASAMTRFSTVNFRSTPSRVVNISSGRARLTMTVASLIRS